MSPLQVVVIGLGAIFAIAGIVLFAKMGIGGENTIKILGAEFKLAGSALVIFVLGCILIILATRMEYDRVQPPPQPSPASTPQPATQPLTGETGIVGTYKSTGKNLEGNMYAGTLTISARGPVYRLIWKDYEGVGILQGDILSVGWGGKTCNVVSYQVQLNSGLYGWWALVGQATIGTEQAVRIGDTSANEVVGSYTVTGRNPNGSSYKGTLAITSIEAIYKFSWKTGQLQTLEGIGVKQGDIISVGWGANTCGVASYRIEGDGSLRGVWGLYGRNQIGTEEAVRQ